jgi:cyclic pyranopterin phosphate synthase
MMIPCSPPADPFGRRIEYLRISLTERCDLRCAYCRPSQAEASPSKDVLSTDDVVNIAKASIGLGITRIRLTGGEPLLRDDLGDIICALGLLPELRDLALTTNGQRLAEQADALRAAGLQRVNVSLDSLKPDRYATLTGGGRLEATLAGIEAALAAGLTPVKVNVVVGQNAAEEEELREFAAWTKRQAVHVRFIEAMPTCAQARPLPAYEVLAGLRRWYRLDPTTPPRGAGPARYYRIGDSPGTVGIIAAISEPFCAECNRLRISARGELLPCLFGPARSELPAVLRRPSPVPLISSLIAAAVQEKPLRYGDVASHSGIQAMHVIGG